MGEEGGPHRGLQGWGCSQGESGASVGPDTFREGGALKADHGEIPVEGRARRGGAGRSWPPPRQRKSILRPCGQGQRPLTHPELQGPGGQVPRGFQAGFVYAFPCQLTFGLLKL